MKKWYVVVFLTLLLCVMPCRAAFVEEIPQVDAVRRQGESYGVSGEAGLEAGISALVRMGTEQIKGILMGELDTGWKLLAVVLLCAVAQGSGVGEKDGLRAVELAGAVAVTALTMTDVAAMIGLGRDTIGRLQAFSEALLPAMTILSAATGGITAAAARQGITVLFSQLLIWTIDRVLVPMLYAFVALHCAHAAIGNPGLQKISMLLKSCVTGLLTMILLAFVGYLTASGAISGSADAAAVKAARITISRAVPVVGSILADASESVLVGAGILRGSVGITGLLVVLAICLTPFLRLAIQYMIYKGTAALCATVANPRLSQLIDAIGSAFGLILGMTGACALVLLVSIVAAVSAAIH